MKGVYRVGDVLVTNVNACLTPFRTTEIGLPGRLLIGKWMLLI